jgi:hypothetical protein
MRYCVPGVSPVAGVNSSMLTEPEVSGSTSLPDQLAALPSWRCPFLIFAASVELFANAVSVAGTMTQ